MGGQKIFECIKAFAYGETPEQAAAAEGIDAAAVREIASACAAEIAEERDMLRKAGYLDG